MNLQILIGSEEISHRKRNIKKETFIVNQLNFHEFTEIKNE